MEDRPTCDKQTTIIVTPCQSWKRALLYTNKNKTCLNVCHSFILLEWTFYKRRFSLRFLDQFISFQLAQSRTFIIKLIHVETQAARYLSVDEEFPYPNNSTNTKAQFILPTNANWILMSHGCFCSKYFAGVEHSSTVSNNSLQICDIKICFDSHSQEVRTGL